MSLIDWVRERAHRHCTALITAQHDAVVQGAQAHHDTRQDLAEARTENERLEQELARARADQAHSARRDMALALAAVLECDPDADQAIERLREQGLDELVERLFELTALRTGLEHVVECPALAVGERVAETARRMVVQANDRSREMRELGVGFIDDEAGVRR